MDLGISLAGQLLQSWDNKKLEQVVAGSSISGPGRRADALLRTSGRIRSLVFDEIKHHKTRLLGTSQYRSGCWPPSPELAGGVTQTQQTVDRAMREIDKRLADTDEHGAETGEATWLIRPRSFLIIGDLEELRGAGGVHPDKHQSFELYRRNLYEPEIITFDELLARAQWHVEVAEQEERPWSEPEPGPRGNRRGKRSRRIVAAIPGPEGGSLTPTAEQSPARHGHRSPQPQPRPPAWNAALRPSQQRAAARRAAAEHELTVRRWLRDLARR